MGTTSEGTDSQFDQALVSKAKHLTRQLHISPSRASAVCEDA